MIRLMKMIKTLSLILVAMVTLNVASAAINVYEFDNEVDQRRFQSLISELRCPTCQNQSIAESNALSAQTMKDLTYELIVDGRSDAEIVGFMVERYGDFATYNPPVKPVTWVLWFGPVVILLLILGYVLFIRRPKETKVPSGSELSADETARLNEILQKDETL